MCCVLCLHKEERRRRSVVEPAVRLREAVGEGTGGNGEMQTMISIQLVSILYAVSPEGVKTPDVCV